MGNMDEDRRVRKTRAQIRKTLTAMLMERDLKDITVSELTRRADINRGTFYLHYKDVYDAFEQTEREILDDFTGIIDKIRHNSNIPLMPILLEAFRYIADNSNTFIAILRTKETTFLPHIVQMCRPASQGEWKSLFPKGKAEHYDYAYSFVTFGCIGLVRRWFENGMIEPPETIAALAERLMAQCTAT